MAAMAQQAGGGDGAGTGGGGGGGGGAGPRKTSVSFGSLMPFLQTLVAPEQNLQLVALYAKMKEEKISREDFVRGARVVAGEKVILEALSRMNSRPPQALHPEQPPALGDGSSQQPPFTPPERKQLVRKASDMAMTSGGQASKKQKADPVQSLEQINDVTAVGGVNLKEEEERLLTAPREESRTTPEMRRKFMEEEGRFFLEKGPLHTKVQEIAAKHGLKSISEDVERCLSMSAEELLWGFLLKTIKVSKQRCDVEKERHRVMATLDFQKQIMAMRKEQREFRQRKQAEEAERLRKLNEEKGPQATEESTPKSQKAQQQNDDKLRTTAANIAARKAVGADDVLSKWMLMAEQRQQKQAAADGWGNAGTPVAGKQQFGAATPRVNARRSALPQATRARSIILRDLVACLEREPGMSTSPLLYRFYERLSSEEVNY
ncbi:transcription initiation factor TFIID subunit 4b-like isoform X1 [Selaginella moellendorffii]|uniref:transcription initiation factor TFIID subunit 4b-like isoform X1 n=1 Tax=Selaginella moellendorffii TaxID=88036 RepID=UPI000D1C5228|nr:transcription initiation factor TFIID subunit 4b-like isoform X1 [Selaginella moellendorffii]|eukprot:XP_024543420.1 transcription initiation factor TFIID subunit 4b-like isoform X1 [Selaginella moellendorffii]